MTDFAKIKARWLADPDFKAGYDALDEEFAIMAALITARNQAALTQAEVAARMQTKQTAIARLESGKGNPSLKTLQSYAAATGTRLKLSFEPVPHAR